MVPAVFLLTALSATLVVAPPPPPINRSDMDVLSSILSAGDVKGNNPNPTPTNSKPSIIDNYVRALPNDGSDSRRPTVTQSLGGNETISCSFCADILVQFHLYFFWRSIDLVEVKNSVCGELEC